MTPETPIAAADAVQDYVAAYLAQDEVLAAARTRGIELGCAPISLGTGAALRFLTTALQARAVVEVGTGTGVSGLCLLRGMAPDGVLTSIDVDPEYQRVARRVFADAALPSGRTRLIMGRGLEVLPRLADGAYDLMFVGSTISDYPLYLEEALRLLRPGGVLVLDNMLDPELLAAVDDRDPEAQALLEVARTVRSDERLAPLLLPLGDGLLLAAKAP
ncbi:O-methyltransferase [Actinoalloteichus hymeniacidonis]|uniref:O-methyltransferase n=1 Tax=Actinoalloteichus hymeniacidonis TaxID=340345 RepID=A0AAC9HMC4_9PSEU|nr:class I SAM-dependent methyltransferase [Actinoalloteichus hymeniacidonis]AOS61758.1 putative O-methyltransferase [Actinoalloteichus hymeniacidonis]MBB5910224.1 putative O-methyltransferase YrrM [Actinoalloteichus hymeniacidonis]